MSTAINVQVDGYAEIKNKVDSGKVEMRQVARESASLRQKMSTTTSGSTAISISEIDTLKQTKKIDCDKTKQNKPA